MLVSSLVQAGGGFYLRGLRFRQMLVKRCRKDHALKTHVCKKPDTDCACYYGVYRRLLKKIVQPEATSPLEWV